MLKHELKTIELVRSKLKIYVLYDLKTLFFHLLEYIENVEHNILLDTRGYDRMVSCLLKICNIIFMIDKINYGKFESYREA